MQNTHETLAKWRAALTRYKSGKRALEQRIIEAEQFWKLRHWQSMRPNGSEDIPASGWLVNAILSKHSDAVDAYPEPVCLARESGDTDEAKLLTSILPVVLRQNDFQKTWSDVWWYKLKSGTGVYGVFWDRNRLGGLGDIAIEKVDILNLFWEPGVRDIQKSKYLFHVTLCDNDDLESRYPQLAGKLGASGARTAARYLYDDAIPTDGKTELIDIYYKKRGVLHYAKFALDTLLFATEGNPAYPHGWYAHGRYPFVFDPLFPEEGYPDCGYGYVDLCKDPQRIVDMLGGCFVKNALVGATPRWFIRTDGGVNEQEYADFTKPFVHVQGRVDTDSIQQIPAQPLPSVYVDLMRLKVDEIKQVAGNRDVNNGGASSVTSASGLALLQEAGNGLSRDMIESGYRAVRSIVGLCIELIREFYSLPRTFRIVGEGNAEQFVRYTNAKLRGGDNPYRLPEFDIDVQVLSESRYSKTAYNQLAIQLYSLGAFRPENADTAALMLGMMDFKGKDALLRAVSENARREKLLRLASMGAGTPNPVESSQKTPKNGENGAKTGIKKAASAAAPENSGSDEETGGEPARLKALRDAARSAAHPRS